VAHRALVGAQYQPRFALSELAAFALPHWLQSGLVAIEPGYEPSPERPFLALDLQTRVMRAYALREVRLPEPSVELPDRPEAHSPDGSRVESDHTLAPDAAQAAHAEKLRLRQGVAARLRRALRRLLAPRRLGNYSAHRAPPHRQ
jgi:hypothetical protein